MSLTVDEVERAYDELAERDFDTVDCPNCGREIIGDVNFVCKHCSAPVNYEVSCAGCHKCGGKGVRTADPAIIYTCLCGWSGGAMKAKLHSMMATSVKAAQAIRFLTDTGHAA